MFGLIRSEESRPRRGKLDSLPGDLGNSRTECELCESLKPTREEYDMQVCKTCEETYLP